MNAAGPSPFERIDEAARAVTARLGPVPGVAVVLGSGLGAFADRIEASTVVSCGDLPHWPVPRVAGHAGRIVAGRVGSRRVLALAGRVHLYEGRSAEDVTFATRVLARAGVRQLVLTNAAGGIAPGLASGTLMVIDDHINFMGTNPLVGPNDARIGPRFPDMTAVYSPRLRAVADEASAATGVPVAHGVYLAVSGPSYETPAEIRAFRAVGADAVGMSTVPEAIAARHAGIEVLGLSCIANLAAGLQGAPLSEQDVLDTAARVQASFGALMEAILVRI